MSTTLLIRHLDSKLTTSEREDFLKHFGAEKVWFINPNSHSAFASFKSRAAADEALSRLHQLELLGRRLTVEYAKETSSSESRVSSDKNENLAFKQFIDSLNSWNPSVNFLQPPPPSLKYKYPPASPSILYNIVYALHKNVAFYVQTLHLMNKMGLDPPFGSVKDTVKEYIKESLQSLDIKLQHETPVVIETNNVPLISTEESEISSDENVNGTTEIISQLPKKRKSNLKRINKIPKLCLQKKIVNSEKKKGQILDTKDVFEEAPTHEIKKIELKVSKTLPTATMSVDNAREIGTIGKIDPLPQKAIGKEHADVDNVATPEKDTSVISSKELLDNKTSLKDMKSLPIFKNYHPGLPSMRLYIKNLSKDVDSSDIERIYRRYIVECDSSEVQMFSVRVMQEGRMKGQAFVSLPKVELCERALSETNGFILKNKPMVVQFARTAK